MTLDEMIAVLQAAKSGKAIESRERGSEAEWYSVPIPMWDFDSREYRVKHKPEPNTPTAAEIDSACLSVRHDYGLMTEAERRSLRFDALEWLLAWRKYGVLKGEQK